jgi:hypothetical protein
MARGVRNGPTPGLQMLAGEIFPFEPRLKDSEKGRKNCTRGKEEGIFLGVMFLFTR